MDIRSRALACRRALLASLCLASTTKNNISEDFREDAVDAWCGWRAPRRGTVKRGCTGASITFSTTHTTPSNDRSALPVRLRALSVPSDRNRSPRGASAGLLPWQERLGRGGRGAQTVGGGSSEHQKSVGAIDEPRSAWPQGHIIYIPGVAAGVGEAIDGGQGVDMRGVLSGFGAPRAKIGYPSMSLTIGCGR